MDRARPLFGMSDKRFAAELAALPPEGRLTVLLGVLRGWKRLHGKWRAYRLTKRKE